MSHVDHRVLKLVMQAFQLDPQVGPQFCIKVGQWFIEQEHVDVAHERTTDGNPLPLSTGQCPWFTV